MPKNRLKLNDIIAIICVFICLFTLLSGCVAAPDTSDNGDEQILTDNSDDTASITRGDLPTIRAQLEADLNKSYKNIKVSKAKVGSGDTMPTYDVSTSCNPDFDFKAMVGDIYSDKFELSDECFETRNYGTPISDRYPAFSEPTYWEPEGCVLNLNMHYYDWQGFKPSPDDVTLSTISKVSYGEIWGSQTGYYSQGDKYFYENYKIHERYRFDIDDPDKNISYIMSDGNEWNIYDAVDYVEAFWSQCLSQIDPEKYEYKVKALYVIALDDESFGYLFDIERVDANGNYYDTERASILDMDSVKSGNPFIVSNSLMTYCAEKEVITRYVKDFSFSRKESTDSGEDLLTLGAASKILSDALASKINLDLTAELNYVIRCKSYPYYNIWEHPMYHQEVCYATCDFEIKPYWCFRTEQCTLMNIDELDLYMVDAVSGELIIMTNGQLRKE